MNNPFVHRNSPEILVTGFSIALPKFDTKQRTVRISDEAMEGLDTLTRKYFVQTGNRSKLNSLIEAIGLFQLEVRLPTTAIDVEGVTTDECRQAGFDDAIEGYTERFLVIYGNIPSSFYSAYLRGYYEGWHVKNNVNS